MEDADNATTMKKPQVLPIVQLIMSILKYMYIHKILESEYRLKSENLTILFVTGGKAIMSNNNLRAKILAYMIDYSVRNRVTI